jgi:hypothetical protein
MSRCGISHAGNLSALKNQEINLKNNIFYFTEKSHFLQYKNLLLKCLVFNHTTYKNRITLL